MQKIILLALIGWSVFSQGMEHDNSPQKSCIGKKRKDRGEEQICERSKTPEKPLQLDDLPAVLHHCILDFLSAGMHKWMEDGMYGTSREDTCPAWCNFSSISTVFRKNAHHWARSRLNITEDEYKLFKQVQEIRHQTWNIIQGSLKAGGISHINHAEWESSHRPYSNIATKNGLVIENRGINFHTNIFLGRWELLTPWGKLTLFPHIQSERVDNIEDILAQQLKKSCSGKAMGKVELYKNSERRIRNNKAARITWNVLSEWYRTGTDPFKKQSSLST